MRDAGVNEQNAEGAGARWYLSRDGQQHGPLSDRELSLFAEGGNFKPGDLLWTAGLDEWKPADALFGLAQSGMAEAADGNDQDFALEEQASAEDRVPAGDDLLPDFDDDAVREEQVGFEAADAGSDLAADTEAEPHDGFDEAHLYDDHFGGEPLDGDHVGALAKALRGEAEAEPRKPSLQDGVIANLKRFGGFCAYLWAVFVLMTLHAVVGGAQSGAGLSFFLLTTVNAFLLMQAMPYIERNRFFQNLKLKPLVYSIVYKTVFFVTVLVLAYAVEMGILGLAGIGGGVMSLGGGLGGMLALWIILCVALLPYFAFKGFEAAVGADMLRKLLFGRP
ncbi:DUF4339 domain-containing protein [Methyloceanibacter sp.]|uniref:DUF4339 domain-containing protein n=1 Tax=Methyloceanibacter sp. TaxID=1965321 RepID=UPI002CC48985|nr:DUF4339 domain-containing protein [Methyloceanibacter sp.]HML92903.1 DUF4339 domain-containing protein [Methyloceanibacter sp.]